MTELLWVQHNGDREIVSVTLRNERAWWLDG